MIALNYHKVDSDTDFYSVTPECFASHLLEIHEQGLRAVGSDEALAATVDGGMVMLHFDDGTEDHARCVMPLLQGSNAKGVFFISTAKINQPGYLTSVQIKELAAAGHSIECHGHSHRRMDCMAPSALDGELASSVALIREWTGRSPRILAPPGGFFTKDVVAAARRHGLGTVRTMEWNRNVIPIRGRLDCLVMTRSTSDKQVRRWLMGRGILVMRAAFIMKQGLRAMLPFDLYLKIRTCACSKVKPG